MTSFSKDLLEVNNDTTLTVLPAIIFVAALMIAGLFGNPLVIYYYGFKLVMKPPHIFIVTLASFDVLVCAISMPIEILDLVKFYTFESSVLCKLVRFINYFAGISSVSVLVAISVDRFKKICKPFSSQIKKKTSRVIIGCIIVFSLSVSWPHAFFFAVVPVNITNIVNETHVDIIAGYDCTNVRDELFKVYITLYNGLSYLFFVTTTVTLAILYSLIGRQIQKQRKFERSFRISYIMKDHAEIKCATDQSNYNKESEERCQQPITSISKSENSNDIKGTANDASQKLAARKRQNIIKMKKFTITMFCISVAFVVSFLPYLGLLTWRVIHDGYEPNHLSKTQLVFFQIFVRSFLINSASNPLIYGFFCADFRNFVFDILRRVRSMCRKIICQYD